MLRINKWQRGFVLVIAMVSYGDCVYADGIAIDKVYNPYVQLLEKEIEYRTLYQQDEHNNQDGTQQHKLGYGQSFSDRFFAEFYVLASDLPNEDLSLQAYELELKWQLSEQGEYNNDWGLLFELEKIHNEDIWEASTTLIALHEWTNWILTGNLSLISEWGDDIEDEWETAFSSQLRYRNSEAFEPAIEFYQAQDTQGIGPVLTGLYRFQGGKKLNWELGAIFGTNDETADVSWKLNIEYEFQ